MKRYINFIFKIFIILLFIACENTSTVENNGTVENNTIVENNDTVESNDETLPNKPNITGLVQKGTFIDGDIRVYNLEENGSLSNLNINSTIDSNGSYKLALKEDGLIGLHAKGKFFNEFTGKNSTDEVKLYALVDYKKSDVVQNINLNLFTSLEYQRVLTLMKDGESYLDALNSTRDSMKKTFGLEKNTTVTKLNIYDLNGTLKDENLNLLLLSGAFLKAIDKNSTTSKTTKITPYQEKISANDFEEFLNGFRDNGLMKGDVWQKMRRFDKRELLDRIALSLGLEVNPPEHPLAWTDTGIGTGGGSYNPPARIIPNANTRPFIMEWKTDENNEEISFSIDGTYDVDWTGDGTWDNTDISGEVTHVYPTAGTHTIKIHGKSSLHPKINHKHKLLSIKQWGDIHWSSMANAFYSCEQLKIKATDAPDLSEVSSMKKMFARTNVNEPLNHWDVSHVTDMSYLFENNPKFNQPLNNWNVSNVTTMEYMFEYAISFNQSIKDWNTSNVSNMVGVFAAAKSFNQPIGNWDVSNVRNMDVIFANAESFNQPIGDWDVSNIRSMRMMFSGAKSFNQPLAKWNVGKVVDMIGVFNGATSFDQPLGDWNISSVDNMTNMFNDVTLSIPNNDNLLLKWSFAQVSHISLPESKYCLGKEAVEQILRDYNYDATGREGTEEECQAGYSDFQIISNPSIQVNENSSDILLTPKLSKLYSPLTLVYSISGIDKDNFDINATTGVLSFKNVPDYEHPTDTNKDNRYIISIKASYGLVYAQQQVIVRVIDVNENILTLPVAQKGPYLQDKAKVTAYPLVNGVRDSSRKVEASIVNLQGTYDLELPLPWSGATELVASGKYYNEVTIGESENPLELSVVLNSSDINSTYPNINIFTDMEARIVKKYLATSTGLSLRVYKLFSHDKIAKLFNIKKDVDFATLNLLNGVGVNKEQNAELLRLSSAVLKTSTIMLATSPKDILNDISDDLFNYNGIEKNGMILLFDMMKDYAKDSDIFISASNHLKPFSPINFVPTLETLGNSVNDKWLNENHKPTMSEIYGDISDDMLTIIGHDIPIIFFEMNDQENDDETLTFMTRQNPFLPIEVSEGETNQDTIDFFTRLDNDHIKYMCQNRSEAFYYINHGKTYLELMSLLDPSQGNCARLYSNVNGRVAVIPFAKDMFSNRTKDEPFIYKIEVNDGEYVRLKEISVLLRDEVRTNPLTEATDVYFDETSNSYTIKSMKPTHMAWATRWSIEGKPDWATFDTSTGELSGTAPEDKVGNYDINITGYKTFPNGLIAKDTDSFTLKLLPTDRVPDAFSIEPSTGVDIHTTVYATITVTGLSEGATISLNGGDGFYQINNGMSTDADGIVHNGDVVTLSMSSSQYYSTTRELTVTIGGVSSTWQVITRSDPNSQDTRPDTFQFTPLTNVELLTMQEASVKITGINANTPISIVNGEYSLDKGATWTSQNGEIVADNSFVEQLVYVRHLSGDHYGAVTQTGLTVGSIGASFTSRVKSSGDKATPPTLTPTQNLHYVDGDFTINFPTDALWKSKVTGVKLVGSLMIIQSGNGLVLVEGTDYTLTDNKLVIHSRALRTRLGNTYGYNDYIGSWNIVVIATGYEDATTLFEVNSGAPIITTSSVVTVPENQTAVIDVNATAQENITFSTMTGYDGNKFSINILTGELRFKVAPDYENPESVAGNNVYRVIVEVRDVSNRTYEQTITVTVTDVDEAPSPTPTIALDLQEASDSGIFHDDNITNATNLLFDVPCPKKDMLIKFYAGGYLIDGRNHTCQGKGLETVSLGSFQSSGFIYRLTYKYQGAGKAESDFSPLLRLNVDRFRPQTPTIATPITGAVISGTAEAGTALTANTPTSSCSTTVDASGNYSCTLTPAPINGESVEVVVEDIAGNHSSKATETISNNVDSPCGCLDFADCMAN